MKHLFLVLPMVLLLGCNGNKKHTTVESIAKKILPAMVKKASLPIEIRFTDVQLEAYLDSVGKLSVKPLVDKVAFGVDSMFRHPKQINRAMSMAEFAALKSAIKTGFIDTSAAKRFFGNIKINDSCDVEKGKLAVTLYFFDNNKNQFNEYAIGLGDPDHVCNDYLYFLKGNKIITQHTGWHRDGLELKHYKDEDGKTVVYYKECFQRGSGIWWYNLFFYKYDGDKIIPILNELENGNMQASWGFRVFWLESFVQKTNPLTIKMVYNNSFADTSSANYNGPAIINDSTIVKYKWDKRSKTLQGQYSGLKISPAQILSYYVNDNDLLFINSHYTVLKASLSKKNLRIPILRYLNNVKNYQAKEKQP